MKQKEYQFDFNNHYKNKKNNKASFFDIGILLTSFLFFLSCITFTWNVFNAPPKKYPTVEKYVDLALPPPQSIPVGLPPVLQEKPKLTDIEYAKQINPIMLEKFYKHMIAKKEHYEKKFEAIDKKHPEIKKNELKNLIKYQLAVTKDPEKRVYGIQTNYPMINNLAAVEQQFDTMQKIYNAINHGGLEKINDMELMDFNFRYRLYLIDPNHIVDTSVEEYIKYIKIVYE